MVHINLSESCEDICYIRNNDNNVVNKYDGMLISQEIMVTKNIELKQEIFSSHPVSKVEVNQIYNSQFTMTYNELQRTASGRTADCGRTTDCRLSYICTS